MMPNVHHDDASEAGHSQKISERTRTWQDSQQFLDRGNRFHSHIGRKKWGQSRLSPVLSSGFVLPGFVPVLSSNSSFFFSFFLSSAFFSSSAFLLSFSSCIRVGTSFMGQYSTEQAGLPAGGKIG